MPESDLYHPIKQFFEQRGFRVRGEVRDCDVCADLHGHVVAIELKNRFELRLLEQAVERQRSADLVYIALPGGAFARRGTRARQQQRLIRRLEVGLLMVDSGGVVEVVFHPERYEAPRRRGVRAKLLTEMASRSVDGNTGGTTGKPRLTAYREEALKVAWLLSRMGPLRPRDLREYGAGKRTQSILYKNYYGWFYRVEHGLYDVTHDGHRALETYGELQQTFNSTSSTANRLRSADRTDTPIR